MKARFIILALVPAALAGCGGGASSTPTIAPARNYTLSHFQPAGAVKPNTPTTVSFVIRNPDGTPLTEFKRGPGPHTGVHLILVRSDLAYIVHRHPPISPNGTIAERITFPAPGTYRAVIDIYPRFGEQPNFQLFRTVHVTGTYRRKPLPPPARSVTVDGYRFTLQQVPRLRAIQAAFLKLSVTDPDGHPATLHAVVRRSRPRDLLPQRLARLLPHARLREGSERLHEPARRGKGHGDLDDARQADGRRPRSGRRDVAAVPPDAGERQDPDGAVHAEGDVMTSGVGIRLAAALGALVAGVAAVILIVLLLRSILG